MKNGRIFVVFAITFLLGFGCAYLVVAPDEKSVPSVTQQDVAQPDDALPQHQPHDDDGTTDNAWPDDADSPE